MAWLHSSPTAKGVADQAQRQTRGEKIITNGGRPLYPDVGEAMYLVGYWRDIGFVSAGGMGAQPLTCVEVMAWQQGAGVSLTPWEFSAIRDMSRSYLEQSRISDKPECPPPYGNPVNEFDRTIVSKKVTNAFQAFMQAKR